MGKKEATTEVANGTVFPTKSDNGVSEKKDVEEMCENTKDDEKHQNKEVNIDQDAKEGEEKDLNGSKEEGKDESQKVGSKKDARKKSGGEKGNKKKKDSEEEKEEPKTPVARTIDRPVRERKSVERLVAIIEENTVKEFHIKKGRGTALKNIPNVAYKLSKKKVSDDTLKLLHNVLYGRRGKALWFKSNILRFSGFVWNENEEKEKAKVQEKLDKCNKEKLFELCDLLDIPIPKPSAKKEDVVGKLLDFLLLPHITTSNLLSEKEHSSNGSKRKRRSKKIGVTPSKKQKSEEGEGNSETEEEEESNEEHEKMNDSEGNMSECESGEDSSKKSKRGLKFPSSKKESSASKKSTESRSKSEDSTPKTISKKKKLLSPKKSASKEETGKKVVKEEKQEPSDDELKAATCEILNQVDFNTTTFTDILKFLAKRFNMDLTSRKATIKLMTQDELTRLYHDGFGSSFKLEKKN